MRGELGDAQRRLHDTVAAEHKYVLQDDEALRWATEDMCPMHFTPEQAATAALQSYRVAVLNLHRESKRARYARAREADPQRPGAL